METYNSSPNILNNEIRPGEACQPAATIYVPSPPPLGLGSTNLAISNTPTENHIYISMHKNLPDLTQQMNLTERYTLMEIKSEPCQVSEVTTSVGSHSSSLQKSRTMSATTSVVKIESKSPKGSRIQEFSQINTNDSPPVGIAAARKKSEEANLHGTVFQPQKDINYFGIRVADIATAGCGNLYFTGSDLVSAASAEDINTGINNMNRSSSTFWQYPTSFPIEPVISMSPVGLQYSRDSSRGQFVFLPTAAAMESFPQATFLWPPYIPQNPGGSLPTPQNFIFPSMGSQSQSHSYAPPVQLLGTNYLTTAAAGTTSTLCQHSQSMNRFVSISSDIKRLDQCHKQYEMKVEDCGSEYNSICKTNQLNANKATKSRAGNGSSYIQLHTNTGFECSVPILPNEPSHILLENSSHPSEFINAPIRMTNFTTPSTEANGRLQVLQDGVSSNSLSPEMQDVNIQTDTPVCSEDEIFLEASTGETNQCIEQSFEKTKSGLTTQTSFVECKGLLKETAVNSMEVQAKNTVFFKESCLNQAEKKSFEKEFTTSDKPNNTNDNLSLNNSNMFINPDCSSFKETNCSVPEMSGLELLSNISTGAFNNHDILKTVCIKEEPYESPGDKEEENDYVNEAQNCNTDNLNIGFTTTVGKNDLQSSRNSSTQNNQQPLGGLNLLCALAEQRIQEEVQNNNNRKIGNDKPSDTKRRKCKHAKLKSSRKSRYYKNNKNTCSKERNEYSEKIALKSDSNKLHVNLKGAFKKIDSSYKKLNKWPDPQEFFKAMESDMRMRLADITRQYKKKKRKLDEINKMKKWKKPSSSEYKFANISCKNPNFICFLEQFQTTSSIFPPTENIESNHDISIPNKNISDCVSDRDENIQGSDLSEAQQSKHKSSFTNNRMLHKIQCNENKGDQIRSETNRKVIKRAQNSLQSNLSITSIQTDDKNYADSELKLTEEHMYRKETRVLTDMGGLFYAGILKPLQPPDVYSVTLDGERGNKSHIMSREEIFKDTILEVAPKSIDDVPTGTRLCAYWSQQYRCLYPGKVIDSEKSDKSSDFVSVEFDDGDSGRIRLENIRFLLSDYPIVEYSQNPFNTLGRNKKTTSIKSTSTQKANKVQGCEKVKAPLLKEQKTEFSNNDSNQISKSFNRHFTSAKIGNINEWDHKHRKHKKRKKSKKHHQKPSLKPTAGIESENKETNGCDHGSKQQNYDLYATKKNHGIELTNFKSSVKVNPEEIVKFEASESNISTSLLQNDYSTSLNCIPVPELSEKPKTRQKVDSYNGKGSKIAAFLPERQLWSWLGHAYRKAGLKGRARKRFYKSITRGKEIITVGECAVFLSTGRPDRPYIGRIEALWETTSRNKVVRVRWFYHPEETAGCPVLKYPGALFVSPHEDENDVQTISHRCEVIEFSLYIAKFGTNIKQYQSVYDNNDTYYLSGYYNPRLQLLKLEPHIPIESSTSA